MEDYSIIKDSYLIKSKRNVIEKLISIQKINSIRAESNKKRRKQKLRGINCPVDSHKLITIDIEDILIEYCPECYGIWFDLGELEKLLNRKLNKKINKNKLFLDRTVTEDVNKMLKKCPVCRKNMIIKKDYNADVFIDICSICNGIWLDTGELAVLYSKNRKDISIKNLLSQAVGKYIDIEV